MSRFFVNPDCPEGWARGLAKPEHWRPGYSAHSLAYVWHRADDVPPRLSSVCDASSLSDLVGLALIAGIPEYKVALPGGKTMSQTDLLALARSASGKTVVLAVEGKAEEAFDSNVQDWRSRGSEGKEERLRFLLGTLQLRDDEHVAATRYQLHHRTASAVIEAERLGADAAAMLVHSFSPTKRWFPDFRLFAALFGIDAEPDTVYFAGDVCGRPLYLGWVSDSHPDGGDCT